MWTEGTLLGVKRMPELNTNIPVFECLVRAEYLYDGDRAGQYEKAAVFAATSVPGRAIGFHCLFDNGAVYGRLPISALAHKESPPPISVGECQLWDCPSEHVSCIEYDLLKESRCTVLLPSGEKHGQYMFTLDWWGSSYAESAGTKLEGYHAVWDLEVSDDHSFVVEGIVVHNCAHIVRLDNGWFAAQPNNRILWECPAFVKRTQKPEYKLTTKVYKCELAGTTGENYFYEVNKPHEPGLGPPAPSLGQIVRGNYIVCATCLSGPCTCSVNSHYEIGSGARNEGE